MLPRTPPGSIVHHVAGILLVLSACALDRGASVQGPDVRDSAGITMVEHGAEALEGPAWQSFGDSPRLRIGVQSGSPELQFTRIASAIRTDKGTIVVLDRAARQLRAFDSTGRFLHGAGRQGEGPGEFRDPARMVTGPDESLIVWDRALRRLSQFRHDGEFIESADIATGSLIELVPLDTGSFLAVLDDTPPMGPDPTGGRIRNAGRLVRLDGAGEMQPVAEFAGTEWELRIGLSGVAILRPWYFARLVAAGSSHGIWITRGTTWEMTRRSARDGSVERIIRFREDPQPFTAALIREIHAAELETAQSEASRRAMARRHEQTSYPDSIPPIGDLFVDTEGRVWIGRMEAPPISLPSGMGWATSRWVVLDQDGESVLGTVTLPPRRRLLHADREGVLVVTVDEADVPYVEWWTYMPS